MIDPSASRRRPPPVDRSGDRWVAVGAIGDRPELLIAATASLALPVELRRGAWLPLHLALAGGAASAIAGVMPFFSAAFAAAPPSDIRLRWSALVAVALGAVGVAIGVSVPVSGLAVVGGAVFIGGIVLTGIVTVRPLRGALGASRGIVTEAYVVALGEVVVGVTLGTLFLAGWAALSRAGSRLKPTRGSISSTSASLVIATTLLHFFPTVIGARIASHRSARVYVSPAWRSALPLVALGYAVAWDLLARVGPSWSLPEPPRSPPMAWRVWPTRGC